MTKKTLLFSVVLLLVWTSWHLVVLRRTGLPLPKVHDEFSYMLQADTFAHGRLTNPPHALSAFFESPHELFRPTYASKYPPGQAMFLALGQVVFGHPFYGVLISDIFMLFAFCLVLSIWASPRAMMVVSVLFAVILSPSMYWTDSYWGGAVAAGGGALVLLAVGLYRKKPTALSGSLFALGTLLLLWTRPYEGGVFTLGVLLVFGREIWRSRRLPPFAAVLVVSAVGIAWTCHDNKAITGHAFQLPYSLHSTQYDMQPAFWFLPLNPEPVYSHPRLAALHGKKGVEVWNYERLQPAWTAPFKAVVATFAQLDPLLIVPLILVLAVPIAWNDPVYRQMLTIGTVFLIGRALETFSFQHYSAPVCCALAVMMASWVESAMRPGFYRSGIKVGVAVAVLLCSGTFVFSYARAHRNPVTYSRSPMPADCLYPQGQRYDWQYRRAAVVCKLSKLDKPQLVFVRYPSPVWNVAEEWVYNSADIDSQRVVFAHDLGAEKDREILNYYPDRTASLLTFDPVSGMEKLEPYPDAAADTKDR